MVSPLSQSAFERIDEVCDRFEAAWKSGPAPRIDDFLTTTAGPERNALQEELLRIETHYRRRVTVPPPASQAQIAGYEMLGELGRGGMGVVYKARQLRPNRLVALKMISAGVHASDRELERFLRESDAVAQLQHANIVQIYEVGEHGGRPYFAMEYVDGGSLDLHLSGTPQPPRDAAEFVGRLAQAIHHAHQHGVIHRDLKPANVLLVHNAVVSRERPRESAHRSPLTACQPKITDFGLAKLLDAGAGNPTQSGDLLGTPSYMAPEQIGGAMPICAATDVYGLGTILYELLTGRPPFRGETALETVTQVQTVEPVSPSRLQPKCPRDLVTICLKCLSKPIHERYASARELADDLQRFLDGKPIQARPIGPVQQLLKWTRRQPMVASLAGLLTVAVIAGVGAGSWFWWQAADGLNKAKIALEKEHLAQAARVATLDRYQIALAHREWLANNGARAGTLLDDCTPEQQQSWEWRYLDRMRHSALHTLAGHTKTVQAIAMERSGRWIASASHDASVRLWDLQTGRGIVLGNHRTLAIGIAFSPDGKLLASSGSNGEIKLWNVQTGARLKDLVFEPGSERAIWAIAFDPDSRFLAVGGYQRVKIWDTRENDWVYDQVAESGAISQVAFSPDGRLLATTTTKVKVWEWTTNARTPLHKWDGHASGTHDLDFSPDGTWLASGGRDCLIRMYSLKSGREEVVLNGHQLAVTSVNFSPDSQRLATAGQDGDMHIWNVQDRRRLFTLHGHSGALWDLDFSPDGTRLASAGSDSLIRVWDATVSQEVDTLPFHIPNEISAVAHGPNARLLAWGDNRGCVGVWDSVLRKEIFRLDRPDSNRRSRVQSIVFRADGRQVGWRRMAGPPTVCDTEKGVEIPLAGTGTGVVLGLAFSPADGTLLAAHSDQDVVRVRALLTGEERISLPRPGRPVNQVIWSPDGTRLVTLEDKRYVHLWDAATGQSQGELEHQPTVTCLAFSGHGPYLAAGGVGGKMRVWDLTTNEVLMTATGHSSNLSGLALSPDGRRLASSASDCTAKLWDTRTGHEVLTLRTQLHEHSPLAFSPDGADLVSVNMDRQLQIWSTRRSPGGQPDGLSANSAREVQSAVGPANSTDDPQLPTEPVR